MRIAASLSTVSKMTEGSEARLRAAFNTLHSFRMSGEWLANVDLMARLYKELMATFKCLYVLDFSCIGGRSALSQKPIKGTLITDVGIENMDFANSCDP